MLFLLSCCSSGYIACGQHSAQLPSMASYFDRLPALPATVEEAHATYYPAGRSTPCSRLQAEIKADVNSLADRSNHQSRLLSMIAGRYEEEDRHVDFTRIRVTREKNLEAQLREEGSSFFNALEDFWKLVGDQLQVALTQRKGMAVGQAELDIYRAALPQLTLRVKKSILAVDGYMEKNGFNNILAGSQGGSPYTMQVLEARGLMLDRLMKLVEQIDHALASVARQIDNCRKHPDQCR